MKIVKEFIKRNDNGFLEAGGHVVDRYAEGLLSLFHRNYEYNEPYAGASQVSMCEYFGNNSKISWLEQELKKAKEQEKILWQDMIESARKNRSIMEVYNG